MAELRSRAAELLKAPTDSVRLLCNGALLHDAQGLEQLHAAGVATIALPILGMQWEVVNYCH